MDHLDEMSDEQLIAATPREPEAFGAFYRRHERPLLVFFLRRAASAELAADLTAEVFAAALTAAPRFRSKASKPAVAWLYGIANNKLASSFNRGHVEESARRRLNSEPLVLTDDALERVEALADAAQSATVLNDLLESLPSEQRDAVRAHVIEDRDYKEIAGELECSQAVIRQRVSRGLRTMRTRLSEESA